MATLAWLALATLAASGADDEPVRVRISVPSGVHYVGESVDLTIAVLAESERPELDIPRTPEFTLTPAGTDLQRVSASAIGAMVETRNVFRFHYVLVAQRAGTLELPAVTARAGDRSGSSRPLAIRIRDVPAEGRPRAFVGGVGPFEITAEADPASVRLGQPFAYRIRMTGPAARNSVKIPVLARFAGLPIGVEVDELGREAVADPPSCTFQYRLRPTRGGDAVLPPVAIAAFDPRSAHYVTKMTPGVPVRVVDVPRFDPDHLRYGASPPTDGESPRVPLSLSLAGLALTVAGLGVLARISRSGRPRPEAARSDAARRAAMLDSAETPQPLAQFIAEGLIEYLRLATDRAEGALTPQEAEHGVRAATEDAELAGRAGRLAERCDRALYGRDDVPSQELTNLARAVFEDLAARPVTALRKTERGSSDREV